MKGAANVGGHRIVAVDVAEIDHLLFEVDGVAGQCLFRRLDFDLAQCVRPGDCGDDKCARDWSPPSRSATSRERPRTAGCRARGSRAYWRWRRCSRPPSGAPTATAPSAKRLERGRSRTRERDPRWRAGSILRGPPCMGLAPRLTTSGTRSRALSRAAERRSAFAKSSRPCSSNRMSMISTPARR